MFLEQKLAVIYKKLLNFTKKDAMRDKFEYNYRQIFSLEDSIRETLDCLCDIS